MEGESDREALEALAGRLGRDLRAEQTEIWPIGGAHAVARVLASLEGAGPTIVVGLCDAAEADQFRRANIEVHLCDPDLEGELIRAVGPTGVLSVIEKLGEMRAWRSFSRQPAQRSRPIEMQLRRFLGTHSGRKALYARALVNACDASRVPPPLREVLASV